MEINIIGLASAAATFLAVWIGHVSVRKIEREVERIWIPSAVAFIAGIGLELASLRTSNLALSAVFGIVGITLLWDSLELAYRQPKRIKEGYAPANPKNRRHLHILEHHRTATTIDWLNRDPRGFPFSFDELQSIKEQME